MSGYSTKQMQQHW